MPGGGVCRKRWKTSADITSAFMGLLFLAMTAIPRKSFKDTVDFCQRTRAVYCRLQSFDSPFQARRFTPACKRKDVCSTKSGGWIHITVTIAFPFNQAGCLLTCFNAIVSSSPPETSIPGPAFSNADWTV